jgi:hypothetical protein
MRGHKKHKGTILFKRVNKTLLKKFEFSGEEERMNKVFAAAGGFSKVNRL